MAAKKKTSGTPMTKKQLAIKPKGGGPQTAKQLALPKPKVKKIPFSAEMLREDSVRTSAKKLKKYPR